MVNKIKEKIKNNRILKIVLIYLKNLKGTKMEIA